MIKTYTMTSNSIFKIEYILPFYIVISEYKIGPVSVGDIFLLLCAVQILRDNNWVLKFSNSFKLFLPFIVYIVVRDFYRNIRGIDLANYNFIIYYLFSYIIIFAVAESPFDKFKLYKAWKIAGIIYILGLFYHCVIIYVFHGSIKPITIIPGYIIRQDYSFSSSYRPLSFFAEPDYFTISIMPLLCMSLERKDYRWSILSTFALLLSTSTTAVVLCVSVWIASLIFSKARFSQKLILSFVGVAIVIIYLSLPIFSSSLEKTTTVIYGGGTAGSRVFAGLDIIRTLDTSQLIFGTNYNSPLLYVYNNSRQFSSDSFALKLLERGYMFLSTFANLVFSYGLVGFLLFLRPYTKLLFFDHYDMKIYIIALIVGLFGERIIFSVPYNMTIMILLLFANNMSTSAGQ